MKKNRAPLVRTMVTDRNGFTRNVWKRPDGNPGERVPSLPAPVPGSKQIGTRQLDATTRPKRRLFSGLISLFSRKEPEPPIREQLENAYPDFTYNNTWLRDQDDATLRKLKSILDVPCPDLNNGWGRIQALKNATPRTINIAYANREFLSDGRTHVQFLTRLAEELGPNNVDPDGRIHNIEAHCEVAREFVSAAVQRTNISGLETYAEAEGLWTAINEHPEMVEQLKKWAVSSIAVGHIFHLSNPDKSHEIVEIVKTLSAHPDQEEKIMDFARARGASFSKEAYEGFEELPESLNEGFL